MKYTTAILFAAVLGLASTASMASTFRCGSQLVSTGDHAFQVLRKCGEPIARQTVGYTLGEYNRHELLIEDWIYEPPGGMLYFLRFIGNRLDSIEGIRER